MGTIFFLALLAVFGAANLVWWRVVDRRLRPWAGGSGGCAAAWRWGVGVFVGGMLAYLVVVGFMGAGRWLPMPVHVFAYLWNLIVLPGTLFVLGGVKIGEGLKRVKRAREKNPAENERRAAELASLPTRRRALGMGVAALAAAPMAGIGLTAFAEAQLGTFRIRRMVLPVAGLPGDLEGITIAHVTDSHIGRFLPAGTTGRIVEAVRGLGADIVAFTGDAMDASQRDIGPVIEFLRELRPSGVRSDAYAIVEGNHDVSHGAGWFESPVLGAGLPLLLDRSKVVRLPGRATPIWLGGITWGRLAPGRQLGQLGEAGRRMMRKNDDAAMAESVATVAAQRRAGAQGAFPILLVHHPHAFDPAAAHGFPLILAGHTHGGQIMLTRNIGAGPLRFRYWSGVHRIGDSR
ncbi:MAG TPA: metallophosphoesterase, partial [Tepidisphaeraceae bacterium]|nr:metallophosphoesterase [Tepidisphaeraceae bacterium]